MNRPKAIGTAAETAVVRYLRSDGFPQAERRALTGTHDQGDITGTPGVAWEVKGGQAAKTASDGQIAAWLAETAAERINAGAEVGVLITARSGFGAANAGRWWAHIDSDYFTALTGVPIPPTARPFPLRMSLHHLVTVLRLAGFGEPIDQMKAAR